MTRTVKFYVESALELSAQGFSTKAAKKQSLESLNCAYDTLRDLNRFYRFEIPYSLCHWRAKHSVAVLAIDPTMVDAVAQIADLFALRQQIDAIEVVKPAPRPKYTRTSEGSHTHRGTCQHCGAVQAVDNTTGQIANHGYRVKWSEHYGTCHGSGYKSLEVSREQTDAQIVKHKAQSEILLKRSEGVLSGDVEIAFHKGWNVQRRANGILGHGVAVDRSELTDAEIRYQIQNAASELVSKSNDHAHHAKMLADLIAARHGQPLYEVVLI